MEKSGIERFVRSDLKSFTSYPAHTSPEFMKEKYGLNPEDIIKLDANENPYGCSPAVTEALKEEISYSVYPDALQTELRRQLSAYTAAPVECIVAGAGSDQLIDLIVRLVINPGDELINMPPTFAMYSFYARLARAEVIEIKRDDSFDFSVAAVEKHVTPKTRLIFLANPNNPSGNPAARQKILQLLQTGVIVVVDEAYYEFSKETVMPLVEQYDNLIVLRTFSKWAGLAGLRIGYGVFPAKLAEYILRIKDPYSINTAAQIAAIESLKDREYLFGRVDSIIMERERLFGRLKQIEGIDPLPSKANFILCRIYNRHAGKLAGELKSRGILVRHFDSPELDTCIRISVGKPIHNEILLDTLNEIMVEGMQC